MFNVKDLRDYHDEDLRASLFSQLWGIDAGASINTPNVGNSALIIEELDWGGQDALNTCENSFFGPHLGLEKQKITWSDLDKPLMWSRHIDFRKICRRIF